MGRKDYSDYMEEGAWGFYISVVINVLLVVSYLLDEGLRSAHFSFDIFSTMSTLALLVTLASFLLAFVFGLMKDIEYLPPLFFTILIAFIFVCAVGRIEMYGIELIGPSLLISTILQVCLFAVGYFIGSIASYGKAEW